VPGVEAGEQIDRVDETHLRHLAEVEQDRLGRRDHAADDAAAEAEGDHRDDVLVGEAQHGLHVGDAARTHQGAGPRRGLADMVADVAQRPIVVAAGVELGGVGDDAVGADRGRQGVEAVDAHAAGPVTNEPPTPSIVIPAGA
jgi:hypothetical protein